MIPALVFSLFFQAATPSEQQTAARFCRALTSSEVRELLLIADNPRDLSGDPWQSVRDFFERYDCISVPSYRARRDGEWLVVEFDGSGVTRNARHERRAIHSTWYLRIGANGIAEAKSETDHLTDAFIAAKDDGARRAIAQEHAEILPAISRQVMVLARRTDRARVKAPAQFLLDWSQRNGDSATEAYALAALARLSRYGGDLDAAMRYSLAADVAARKTNDPDVIAYVDAVGSYMATSDDVRKRLRDAAIDFAESLNDPYPALYALLGRAGEGYNFTDFSVGYRDNKLLLDTARRYGSREWEMQALQLEAAFREELGDWTGTLQIATQNAMLAREQLNAEYESRSSHIVGESYAERTPPDYERAVVWLQRAVDTLPPTLMRGAIFQANLGDALVHVGRAREAEKYLQPALAGTRSMDYQARAYVFAEHLRRALGRSEEAMDFARKGIEEVSAVGTSDLYFVWELKADLGNMLIECGDVDSGIEALREAIDLIESRRVLNTSDTISRAHHFASRQWVYESLLDVLVRQKRFEEAFVVAEKMKARALDDSFAGQKERVALTKSEQAEQVALNQRIVDLNRKLGSEKGEAEAKTRSRLREARADLETFNSDMAMRYSKSLAAQTVADPLNVAAALHGTVIEYAVLPRSVIVFVVHDRKVTGAQLKTNRSKIEHDAALFTASLRKRDLNYVPKGRALYDDLIRPVAAQLKNIDTVTIVPDGFLWGVPFDALMTPARRFLVEEHALVYAPSVMMLDAADRHPKSSAAHELLAVGDPTVSSATRHKAAAYRGLSLDALPDAAREARALADLYGRRSSTVLTHATAREAEFKKLAPGYRIIHLATHGIVDDDSSLYSALVLGRSATDREDGLLEMREVRDLDLHAGLIVLSACDTARGTLYPGEGVIGLSWAFLISGCPTTVVSQWNVESRSTSQLMIDFHRHLLAGDTTAAALRNAKLALMRNRKYAHPLYWAPFIVVGDGASKIR